MATSGEQREHGGNHFFPNEDTPLIRGQDISTVNTAGAEESLIAVSPWQKPKYFILIETAIFTNVFLAGFDGTVTASTYAVISSDLQQSNLASWISTSYLLTSTAIQPLYGRFSDIFGRRACLLMATAVFGLGCLGCACSTDMTTLIMMKALAGLGGGGLMTMNLIPKKQRGIYQAFQNILHGSGAICGTTLGGVLSDTIGWRICFLGQVPVALAGLCLAAKVVKTEDRQRADVAILWNQTISQLDLLGAALLFAGLVLLLAALTLGVERSWDDWLVIMLFSVGVVLLMAFIVQEYRYKGLPILPLDMMNGYERVGLLVSNISLGITAYGILFLMPFFFQTVLLDTASSAGLRLVPPSLGTPIGGLITGIVMRQGGDHLTFLTRLGLTAMLLSNILLLTLGLHEKDWKYSAYLTLGNFAQGMVYPSILFGFIRTTLESEHAVATSLVYLTRSLGTVWGVSSVATIVQGSITQKLEVAFGDLPGGPQALKKLLKSISEIRDLEPELRNIAIKVAVLYHSDTNEAHFT
ncbi:multidrug efflux transporter (Eurofung) [Fusarium globosum]|uniref:Multidrug efflux transporter (Eurofung) n=1 Tax=Fusarium globosum TaxID=78864 RepID=A0A8H5XV00_9HYPO|nr:multidrug efflux transporter (Eurofung) [Fusarium globosum]